MTNSSRDFNGWLEGESCYRRPAPVAIDLWRRQLHISLLRWNENNPEIQLVHRFASGPINERGTLHWDVLHIRNGIATSAVAA